MQLIQRVLAFVEGSKLGQLGFNLFRHRRAEEVILVLAETPAALVVIIFGL